LLPFRSDTVSDAYAARATRFLHGYFTGHPGALRFALETEDASRHKMLAAVNEKGDALSAMNALAKRLDPAARAFSTTNPEATSAWGRGEFERAVGIDPGFGAAWLGWIDQLASHGSTADAIGVAHRALAQPSLRSPVDRARIEVAAAALAGNVPARNQALAKLAGLTPNDIVVLEQLAEGESNARNFTAAAGAWRKASELDPENGAALNSLGYAEAEAGNLDASRAAFEAYGRMPGQKTNSLDSLGEAYFINGRFAEAEKYFLAAQQSDPSFLAGADLFKAAYAHWLGGDLKGADAVFTRYLDLRRNDPLRPWREAVWLYSTGRREAAIARLQSAPANPISQRQLAVWNAKIAVDEAALRQKYERTPPTSDGQARVFYAEALVAAGKMAEARPLLTRWPLPDEHGGDPLLESLLFPKFLELRKQAGLAGSAR